MVCLAMFAVSWVDCRVHLCGVELAHFGHIVFYFKYGWLVGVGRRIQRDVAINSTRTLEGLQTGEQRRGMKNQYFFCI